MKTKKSWQQKLHDSKGLPKICQADESHSKRWTAGTFVVPAPIEVDELMKAVPEGRITTMNELRAALARKHHTDIACPLTTGIFAWIAAHAAEESKLAGANTITPYWRTLKADGEINPKYPGGSAAIAAQLASEGQTIAQKGKRFLVVDYKKSLWSDWTVMDGGGNKATS